MFSLLCLPAHRQDHVCSTPFTAAFLPNIPITL